MAGPESRVLAAAPREQSGHRRAQPPTATSPGSETAAARSCQQQLSFRPKAFRCRGLARRRGLSILPTTTQLRRKSGFWKHFRLAAAHRWNLANNNVLAWMRFLPDKGKRTMLSTEQINDLHRLYWSEHWPIRKIERHLRMGWHTIRKYLDAPAQGPAHGRAPANSIPSRPPSPNGWKRTPPSPAR